MPKSKEITELSLIAEYIQSIGGIEVTEAQNCVYFSTPKWKEATKRNYWEYTIINIASIGYWWYHTGACKISEGKLPDFNNPAFFDEIGRVAKGEYDQRCS